MTDSDDLDFDRPLTPEEEEQAGLLTPADLQRVDECLLSHMSYQWQKVAGIIGLTMRTLDNFGFPDVFYSLRIKRLAESGVIEAVGNLNRMRHSEIRLPSVNNEEQSE